MVHLLWLCRPALSVLQATYRCLNLPAESRAVIPREARQELRMAANLGFLAAADRKSEFNTEVLMEDSADFGYALTATHATAEEIRRETRFRERSRFAEAHTVSDKPLLGPGYLAWS